MQDNRMVAYLNLAKSERGEARRCRSTYLGRVGGG